MYTVINHISSDIELNKRFIHVTYNFYKISFILWVGIKPKAFLLSFIVLHLPGLILILSLLSM